jgi:glycosyltransferase involved in cell wall biosynthesis
MKIGFYSPYLPDHFGGGEKYVLDTALVYARTHQVTIALPAGNAGADLSKIRRKYEDFLGKDLSGLMWKISPLGVGGESWWRRWGWSSKFDVMYYVTDGSAFLSLAKKSIMHIQVPLLLGKKRGWEKIKFNSFRVVNTNSYFTKKIVERYWGIKVNLVCQPGVMVEELMTKQVVKNKTILHVGRFFANLHTKNQEVLVQFFRQLREQYPEVARGWRLVLIGSVESEEYLRRVQQVARGLPVQILTAISRADLVKYYQQAAIYWHATGWQAQEWKEPEKMEHFGISTVEAMAAGAAPVVLAKGGQREILGKNLHQWGWETMGECIEKTVALMKEPALRAQVSELAVRRAGHYAYKNFEKRCWGMLGG